LERKKELRVENSEPLSDLKHFRDVLNWFSSKATKFITLCLVSDLALRKITHVNLEKSSTRVKNYLWPKIESVAKGPHRSACSNSNGA
jgi:hypothetical protein